MAIDYGKFSAEIRSSSGFNTFIERTENSSLFRANLEYYTNSMNGVFEASSAGTFTAGPTQINIQTNDLPVSGDEASLARFFSAVAHEIGHTTMPGGTLSQSELNTFYTLPNANAAANLQLGQEGVASYFEYLASKELGFSIRGGPELERTLDSLAADMGNSSTAFRDAAIGESIKTYGELHPSTAPNISYREYYSDSWYAYKADLAPSKLNWLNFTSNTIQAQDLGNGVTRVTSSEMLPDGPYFTSSFSMELNGAGEVIGKFKAIENFDGFKYAEVFGQGSYYLNDTIVSLSRTSPSGLYASIIGDGNDLYVFDGNEVRVVGDRNFMDSVSTDKVFVNGRDNTISFDNLPSRLEINGSFVSDYLGSISYVDGNAFGDRGSGIGSGGNFGGAQVPTHIPIDEHRGAEITFLIAIPAPVEHSHLIY